MTRAEITARLTGDRGQPLKELSWWSRLDAALADPVVRVVVLWLMRQSGKTQALMVRAIGDLLLLAGAFTLFVSAGREQAETLFRRKCRLPLLRLLRAAGIPPATFRTTKTVIENLTTGAALEVVSPNELTVPSRSVSLLVIDEARYVSDEVFAALAPSVIGAGGKILLASTAGKPSGFFHDLATRPDPEVAVIRVDGNENPYADPTIIGFLGRLLGRLLPVAAKRDLDNLFAEDGDRYIPGPLWDQCIAPDWSPLWPTMEPPLFVAIDAAYKGDTCAAIGVIRDGDQLILALHKIWRPSRAEPLDLREVEEWVLDVHRHYHLVSVVADPYQMARSIAALKDQGVPITEFPQTPANLTKMTGVLFEALTSRALVLYPSEELAEQGANAVVADTVRGFKIDKARASAKIDAIVALAMAVTAMIETPVWTVSDEPMLVRLGR